MGPDDLHGQQAAKAIGKKNKNSRLCQDGPADAGGEPQGIKKPGPPRPGLGVATTYRNTGPVCGFPGALFDDNGFRGAVVSCFLYSTFQVGGNLGADYLGDIVAHLEYVGNTVGTQPASRAQISINPYLHVRNSFENGLVRLKRNINREFLQESEPGGLFSPLEEGIFLARPVDRIPQLVIFCGSI
jgi:hypothetical protein